MCDDPHDILVICEKCGSACVCEDGPEAYDNDYPFHTHVYVCQKCQTINHIPNKGEPYAS